MDSDSNRLTPGDHPRCTEAIVERLKSQGLFDQFRKDCLADVDTKPAYQNLGQRVENYVSQFLMKQKWSPGLNKNKLREQLRNQINQSGMLLNGVKSIVEQVIHPKINTVFKPQVDKVVCEYLGIEPDKCEHSQERNQEGCSQYPASIMDNRPFGYPLQIGANFGMSLPKSSNEGSSSFDTSIQAEKADDMPCPPDGEPPPPPPLNDDMPPPPPESELPPLPPAIDLIPMESEEMSEEVNKQDIIDENSGSDMDIESDSNSSPGEINTNQTMLHEAAIETIQLPPDSKSFVDNVRQDEHDDSSLDQDDDLDQDDIIEIPLPKDEPTNESPTKKMNVSTSKEMNVETKVITEEIPLPFDNENDLTSETDQFIYIETEETLITKEYDETVVELNGSSKTYKFSWNKEEDELSNVTVSSVHTSDLSSFEDSDSDSDESHHERYLHDTSLEADVWSTAPTEESKGQSVSESMSEKRKPKRLLSLQYNYSDDEEETREGKKLTMAREKEERYMKRQQRRAEIIIKQKEREEEKAHCISNTVQHKRKDNSHTKGTDEESVKRKRSKKVLKKQLTEQKVMEKRTALRTIRQRTINTKYADENFDSYFSLDKTKSSIQEATVDSDTVGDYESQHESTLNEMLTTESEVTASEVSDTDNALCIEQNYVKCNENISTEQSSGEMGEEMFAVDVIEEMPCTPTMDEPGTPTQDELSIPGTPTCDEADLHEDSVAGEQSSIPIYQLTPTKVSGGGSFVHYTRSKSHSDVQESLDLVVLDSICGKQKVKSQDNVTTETTIGEGDDMDSDKPISRSATPSSISSDLSKSSSVPSDVSKPQKSARRRATEDSLEDTALKTKILQGQSSEKGRRISKSQRYDSSDLYKPHKSRRRSSPTSSTSSYNEQGL